MQISRSRSDRSLFVDDSVWTIFCALTRALTLVALIETDRLEARDFDPFDPYDSGGPLSAEQAAYDVEHYDLAIEVFPETKSISGTLTMRARIGLPLGTLVFDLDPRLEIRRVTLGSAETFSTETISTETIREELEFVRQGGKVRARFPRTVQPNAIIVLEIEYGGVPREAPMPPWSGGLTWETTPSGAPWIATTCQGEGADLWWPVKDHVSDEPNAMDIRVTVPEPLVVASNGRLERVEALPRNRRTFHWHVSTPINTYNVALNIAPYILLEASYDSVTGETVPVVFYVLPENVEKGRALLPEIIEHLRFFERRVGPYPFRRDKYGVAQTPHLGMEHQSIIAYGAGFDRGAMTGGKDWGFDVLHHHELSHEWWGNLVTNADWNDMWIHEGFGSYMQPLWLEDTQGRERAADYLQSIRRRVRNDAPVAPREATSAKQVYTGDIYFKGAWILHTLRYLLGDEVFFTSLRRMAYPDPELERSTDGRACRFATTDDYLALVESLSGQDLDWFFEVYLHHAPLPCLRFERREQELFLAWEVENGLDFPMPIDVRLGMELRRTTIPAEGVVLPLAPGLPFEIDPDVRVLRSADRPSTSSRPVPDAKEIEANDSGAAEADLPAAPDAPVDTEPR
jgi:aminopeptidase N